MDLKYMGNDMFSKLSKNDLLELKKQLQTSKFYYRDSLGLSKYDTFGTEIEYENLNKQIVDNYIKTKQNGWVSDFDNTVPTGGEIKSYLLTDKKSCWNELSEICSFLEKNDAVTNQNAGGHIHIGSHILKGNYNYWRQFIKTYVLYEKELIVFFAGEEKKPRRHFENFANPIAPYILENIDYLNNATSFEDIYYQVFLKDRNWAVNFTKVLLDSSKICFNNTTEYRSPNSSKKCVIWQNNINTAVKTAKAPEKGLIDEELIDYRLSKGLDIVTREKKALQFVDLVFDNNIDKLYFLKQYTKSLNFGEELHLGKVKSYF